MSWQTEVSKSKSDELFDHLPVTLPAWQAYTPQELQTLGGYFTVLHFQHPGEVALVQDQLVSFVAVILQGNMKVVMRPTGDKKTSSSKSLLNDPNNPPDIKSSSSSLPQVKKDSDLRFDVGPGNVLGEMAFFAAPQPCKRNSWLLSSKQEIRDFSDLDDADQGAYIAVINFKDLFKMSNKALYSKLVYTFAKLSQFKSQSPPSLTSFSDPSSNQSISMLENDFSRQKESATLLYVSESLVSSSSSSSSAVKRLNSSRQAQEFLFTHRMKKTTTNTNNNNSSTADNNNDDEDFDDDFDDDVDDSNNPSNTNKNNSNADTDELLATEIKKNHRFTHEIKDLKAEVAELKKHIQLASDDKRLLVEENRKQMSEIQDLKRQVTVAHAANAKIKETSQEHLSMMITQRHDLNDYRICFRLLQRAFFRKNRLFRTFLQEIYLKLREMSKDLRILCKRGRVELNDDCWQYEDNAQLWLREIPLTQELFDRIKVSLTMLDFRTKNAIQSTNEQNDNYFTENIQLSAQIHKHEGMIEKCTAEFSKAFAKEQDERHALESQYALLRSNFNIQQLKINPDCRCVKQKPYRYQQLEMSNPSSPTHHSSSSPSKYSPKKQLSSPNRIKSNNKSPSKQLLYSKNSKNPNSNLSKTSPLKRPISTHQQFLNNTANKLSQSMSPLPLRSVSAIGVRSTHNSNSNTPKANNNSNSNTPKARPKTTSMLAESDSSRTNPNSSASGGGKNSNKPAEVKQIHGDFDDDSDFDDDFDDDYDAPDDEKNGNKNGGKLGVKPNTSSQAGGKEHPLPVLTTATKKKNGRPALSKKAAHPASAKKTQKTKKSPPKFQNHKKVAKVYTTGGPDAGWVDKPIDNRAERDEFDFDD